MKIKLRFLPSLSDVALALVTAVLLYHALTLSYLVSWMKQSVGS